MCGVWGVGCGVWGVGCGDKGSGFRDRLTDSCITQLKAQGPSRTYNESTAEEEGQTLPPAYLTTGQSSIFFSKLSTMPDVMYLASALKLGSDLLRVVHSGRSTCHGISGRWD